MKTILWVWLCLLALSFEVAAEEPTYKLTFKDASIEDVAIYYEKLSGKEAVYDNSVLLSLTLTLGDGKFVTKTEAISTLEAALQKERILMVPTEDGKQVKVVSFRRGRSSQIYFSIADLPKDRQPATFFLQLRHADAIQIAEKLRQQLSKDSTSSFISFPRAKAILITEEDDLLPTTIKLAESLDAQAAEATATK